MKALVLPNGSIISGYSENAIYESLEEAGMASYSKWMNECETSGLVGLSERLKNIIELDQWGVHSHFISWSNGNVDNKNGLGGYVAKDSSGNAVSVFSNNSFHVKAIKKGFTIDVIFLNDENEKTLMDKIHESNND